MGSKRKIKVGDDVLCIKEPNLPEYIGTIWRVTAMKDHLYYCVNYELYDQGFVFKKDEIVIPSSLIRELL